MTELGMSAVAWGSLGQWVSAAGTIGLGLVSLYLASRGEKRARELTARQIVHSISFTEEPDHRGGCTLRMINAGTTPVRDLRIPCAFMDPETGDEGMSAYRKPLLLPGETDEVEMSYYEYNASPEFTLDLTDIHVRSWRKTLGGDVIELTPTKPGRMKRRWRWIVSRPSAIRSRLKK